MKKIFILTLSLICLFSITGCSNNSDDVKTFGDVKNNESNNEKIDYSNTEQVIAGEPPIVTFEPTNSYYVENSNATIQTVYKYVVEQAKLCKEDITFPSPMSITDAKKMMNIVFFDTPELFHLTDEYTLKLNDSNLAIGISLKYRLNKNNYDEAYTTLEETTTNIVSNCRENNEYEAIQELSSGLMGKRVTSEYIKPASSSGIFQEYNGNYLNSLFGIIYGDGVSSVGYAKFVNYIYRQVGLNSMIVLGQTSNSLSSLNYDNKSVLGSNDEVVTYQDGDKTINASYDYDKTYAWNLVRIKNKWYHVDYTMASLYFNENSTMLEQSFILMNDYQASLSRVFYQNEKYLDVTPVCNDTEYIYNNVNNTMFSKVKESLIKDEIKKTIENMHKNSIRDYNIQFESEDNYYTFVNEFKNLVNEYNKENGYVFSTYDFKQYDKTLIVRILNIRYKE